MKKLYLLGTILALASSALAQTLEKADAAEKTAASAEPPQKIDVSRFPKAATMVDNVVVPAPNEVFAVLDKLGQPHWSEVLRPTKGVVKPIGGTEQTALLLGTVIAEGFIAVESGNSDEVKNIGKSVLNLAGAIGVRKAVLNRSNSIIEGAEKKDWAGVKRELDGAQKDVKKAMAELNSEEVSQLVSLGGWLRGTEALTAVVKRGYTKDGAELLHQPILLDYFDRRIASMDRKRKENPLVIKVQQGLVEIRPLMGIADNVEISEKTVKDVGEIAERLIKAIQSKNN